jgi:Cu(I)/Ag(I) efflux system membrane protein CusA/SilA
VVVLALGLKPRSSRTRSLSVVTASWAPNVKTIRGFSDFGYSFVYVVFMTRRPHQVRSRVLEHLPRSGSLPRACASEIGPDATGVGWVFQYALVDDRGQMSLADLRTLQD